MDTGVNKTYDDIMYELGDAMDKGTCTIENFIYQLEVFYEESAKGGVRATPLGDYPHKFLKTTRGLNNTFNFIHKILVRSPKGLIRYLVENELIPPKAQIERDTNEIIRIACGNPDPNASVLQYLVETAKLIQFIPDNHLLSIARTEQTIRFLLRRGVCCKGVKVLEEEETYISYEHVEPQFVLYPLLPNQKAGKLRALFDYGTDYPLRQWAFIDLDSFQVIETFRPREEIIEWINESRHDICMDRYFHLDVWPYLFKKYGLQFTAEEFICALTINNGASDWEYDDFKSNNFVLTYKWIRDRCYLKTETIEYFFQRLATLINYNRTVVPFSIASNLNILDRYLIWNKYTIPYFSHALKKRLFTIFCVFRRQFNSTLALKFILPTLVPRIVSDAPYEEESERNYSFSRFFLDFF